MNNCIPQQESLAGIESHESYGMRQASHHTMLHSRKYSNGENRREIGLSLITIAFMLWFFDLLVTFFLPAGYRTGHQRPFLLLIGSAAIAGAILLVIGWKLKND